MLTTAIQWDCGSQPLNEAGLIVDDHEIELYARSSLVARSAMGEIERRQGQTWDSKRKADHDPLAW